MWWDKLSTSSVSLAFCVGFLILPSSSELLTPSLGWAGGILGIFLARNNQRNVVPSLMSATSYLPFLHASNEEVAESYSLGGQCPNTHKSLWYLQRWSEIALFDWFLDFLSQVHAAFGYTLMLAGVTRMIEVCFVAKHFNSSESLYDDSNSDHTLAEASRPSDGLASESGSPATKAFRHLPPFVCYFYPGSLQCLRFSRAATCILGVR